jgi:rhodanese-related sulfurtransferase/DNA-binding transcriptional ArsR family regulator
MDKRTFKDTLYEQFARIGRAVSSPKRLEILDLLCQGEKSVEVLADQVALTIGNASAHLKALRGARLVETRREGQFIFYRVADPAVCEFWLSLRALGDKRLAEVRDVTREYFTERDQLSPLDKRQLLARARKGEIIVLDVRPADEYRSGHLPFARSVPAHELERKLASLPKSREIVAYCRGPYCVWAYEAVSLLRRRGYRATRFEDGVTEWRAAGLPVEQKGAEPSGKANAASNRSK